MFVNGDERTNEAAAAAAMETRDKEKLSLNSGMCYYRLYGMRD